MPYIDKKRRKELGPIVEEMVRQNIRPNGDINYILFKYATYHVPKRYNVLKNYIAELREAADWVWWMLLVPYEKNKRKENGDV